MKITQITTVFPSEDIQLDSNRSPKNQISNKNLCDNKTNNLNFIDKKMESTKNKNLSLSTFSLPTAINDNNNNNNNNINKNSKNMHSLELAMPSTEKNKSFEPMARHIRTFVAGKHKRRLVQKTGECNVTNCNVTKRKQKYLVDIFTTLVDMRWRYHIVMFAAAFAITWCLFGLIWFIIAIVHEDHLNHGNETWVGCVNNVYDYPSALLFSIETQTTIGYGFRVIQTECGFAIFLLMLQSCVGLFIQSLITGIIFAKISRPKGRSQTIMFSEKAVICKRDNEYNLLFRVGDMRKSHIIGTSIRAVLVKNRLTSEGESIPLCQFPLTLETEMSQSDSFVFLIWPVTVVHRINESSPLYDLSLENLLNEHFEIIVLLEGTIESTGMSTQVRTSYIPLEIMWGEQLVPLLTFQLQNGRYEIDYCQFHSTTSMTMPDCSAKEYAEKMQQGVISGKQKGSEYIVSFTAPAIRQKPQTSTSRSLHHLFHRKKNENINFSSETLSESNKFSKKYRVLNKKSLADPYSLNSTNTTSVTSLNNVESSPKADNNNKCQITLFTNSK